MHYEGPLKRRKDAKKLVKAGRKKKEPGSDRGKKSEQTKKPPRNHKKFSKN